MTRYIDKRENFKGGPMGAGERPMLPENVESLKDTNPEEYERIMEEGWQEEEEKRKKERIAEIKSKYPFLLEEVRTEAARRSGEKEEEKKKVSEEEKRKTILEVSRYISRLSGKAARAYLRGAEGLLEETAERELEWIGTEYDLILRAEDAFFNNGESPLLIKILERYRTEVEIEAEKLRGFIIKTRARLEDDLPYKRAGEQKRELRDRRYRLGEWKGELEKVIEDMEQKREEWKAVLGTMSEREIKKVFSDKEKEKILQLEPVIKEEEAVERIRGEILKEVPIEEGL